jgi:hypothetical protein
MYSKRHKTSLREVFTFLGKYMNKYTIPYFQNISESVMRLIFLSIRNNCGPTILGTAVSGKLTFSQ